MRRPLLAMLSLLLGAVLSCSKPSAPVANSTSIAPPPPPAATIEAGTNVSAQLQEDTRRICTGVFGGDIDIAVRFAHPRLVKAVGGIEAYRRQLQDAGVAQKLDGVHLDELTFPSPPTFHRSQQNEFAVVPFRVVLSAKGKRLEMMASQLGVREIGKSTWSYIDGSRADSKTTLVTLFPDLPAECQFPPNSTRVLE